MAKKRAKKSSRAPSIKAQLQLLNNWNIFLGSLLVIEALALVLLAKSPSLPITTSFLTLDSLSSAAIGQDVLAPATRHLFDIKISYLVAAALLVPAAFFFIQAIWQRKSYEKNLKKGFNKLRWLEYVIGGGLVVLTVSLLNGIYDASTLLSIFALTEILALFALLVESRKELKTHPRVVNKLAFVAWVTPWLIIAFYLFGASIYGSSLPVYVYFLDGSLLLIFLAKALNMLMITKKRGRWSNYLYGERVYLTLSFLAASALAWQIFFGTLR